MDAGSSGGLSELVLAEVGALMHPLGIELDEQWCVVRTWGGRKHYGFESLTKGDRMAEHLPLLQGLQAPIEVDLPFVAMPNGRYATVQLRLDVRGGYLILTDDTEEKLRYQSLSQIANETVINAYRRAQAEEALFQEKELAEVTLQSIGDGVIRTDQHGAVTYLNPIAETMTGWSNAQARGQPVSDVFKVLDGSSLKPTLNPIHVALTENRIVGLATNSALMHRSGKVAAIEDSAAPIHDREGAVIGAVLVFHDVSEARAMAARMTHLARHDYLTGLPNRVMLHDRIGHAIELAKRHRKRVALMFLDLDRFKHVNDALGHLVGDKLLQQVARRLESCVRASDTVSRQGGDEFVVLLSEIDAPSDPARIAEKLLRAVEQPYVIDGHELEVTLSIGISIFPDDGKDAEDMAKRADTAMYHAKENGRNNYQFFTPSLHDRALARSNVEQGLRRALRRREFVLHYQPKIALDSGDLVGVEALVRWQHPTDGLIAPADFVGIAEDSGLMDDLSDWILREACIRNRRWQAMGLPRAAMAVNVSASSFRDKRFLERIGEVLQETGLAPECLELELTEGVIMEDAPHSVAYLESLRRMGVKLAIDDFGTGYSSLAYLQRLCVDTLKIDQSFVRDIGIDGIEGSGGRALVDAIITMAKGLQRRVIAEGVETREQLRYLQAQRCDEAQGFYLSKPMPAAEFEAFAHSGEWRSLLRA